MPATRPSYETAHSRPAFRSTARVLELSGGAWWIGEPDDHGDLLVECGEATDMFFS